MESIGKSVESSREVSVDFRSELQATQRKLYKLGSAPEAVLFPKNLTKKQAENAFHEHYDGPERDLVSVTKPLRAIERLLPLALSLALIWPAVSFIGPLVTTDDLSTALLVSLVITGMITGVGSAAVNAFSGPQVFLGLRNRTINRKRYQREMQKFWSAEEKKRELHEAATRKYHKKRERVLRSLEPLSKHYAIANPGKKLTADVFNKVIEVSDNNMTNIDILSMKAKVHPEETTSKMALGSASKTPQIAS